MLRIIILACSAALAAGLLFINVYTSVVDAVSWGAAIPESIHTARDYFRVVNPGTFFRILSPLAQLFALVAVVACWKLGRIRYIALAAFVLMVSVDVFTFGFFYPRNEIMFIAPFDENVVKIAWQQWSAMNWLRSAMCLGSTVFAMVTLVLTVKKSAI
jgi:hypothetical protein